MAKPPRIRHSKSRKDAVTIDLEPGEVKRADEAAGAAEDMPLENQAASTVPDESVTTDPGLDRPEPAGAGEAETAGEAPEAHEEIPSAAVEAGGSGDANEFGRAAPPPEEPARSGRGSALTGGVVGAVIALAVAGFLLWAGVLPGLRGTEPTGTALEVLRGEIAVLRQEIEDARAAEGEPADAEGEPADAEATEQTNARIEEMNSALGQLRADLDALQSTAPQDGGGVDASAVQALETRLARLEETVSALPADPGTSEEVDRRLAAVEDAQRSATEAAATQASRLEQLERSVAEVSEQVEGQSGEPGMMVAVAAAALKSAIDRGTPFMTELETYATVAPDSVEVAELRDLAASGVPTHAQIEAELDGAANRMIAATRPVDPNAGFVEQLWSSAQSLVQVRPVGQVEGESAPAIVARMEVALRNSDYEAALREYEALPEPAKVAGSDFIKKVRARLTADQLIARALSRALATQGSEG